MGKKFGNSVCIVLTCLFLLPSISYANGVDSNEVEKENKNLTSEVNSRYSSTGRDANNASSTETRQKIDLNRKYDITVEPYNYNSYYFEFDVPTNGYIEFKMDKVFTSDGQMRDWDTLLTNKNGEKYLEKSTTGSFITDDDYIYYKIGLKQGKYYLDLTSAFSLADEVEKFPFSINFTATEYFEKENNNTIQSANELELGKTYNGIAGDGIEGLWPNISDFFTFTTTTTGDVKFKIKHDPDIKFYDYHLKNKSGEILEVFNEEDHMRIEGTWLTYTFKNMSPGTYYLEINSYYELPYEMNMSFQYSFVNHKTTKVTDMKKYDGGSSYLTYINGKGYSQYFYENNTGTYQFIPSSWLEAAGLNVQVKTVSGKKMLYITNTKVKSVVQVEEKVMPYVASKITQVNDMKKYDAGKAYHLTYINGKAYSQFFYENMNGTYQFIPSSWLKAAGLNVEIKTVGGTKKLYISNPQ